MQVHKTINNKLSDLYTSVNELNGAVSEINEAINIITTYICFRDNIMADNPQEQLFGYIEANVTDEQLFRGTMTDLYNRADLSRFYKGAAAVGKLLKANKESLANRGFVVSDKDSKGVFEIFKV